MGVWPEGGQYALLFGFWAGVTEVIPYVGPFIGAVPPVIAAFFHSPTAALVVIIVYFVIQQLESHILAPNIVGSSVGVHPLIVIFALLAGAQIGGIVGIIAALPLLAMLRHTLQFYQFERSKAPWAADDGIALIPARSGGTSAPEGADRARGAAASPARGRAFYGRASRPEPQVRAADRGRRTVPRRVLPRAATGARTSPAADLWRGGDTVTIASCRGG